MAEKLYTGEEPQADKNPQPLYVPEQYGEPKGGIVKKDAEGDAEKRAEEQRRIEEDAKVKFKDRRGEKVDNLPIPEIKKTEKRDNKTSVEEFNRAHPEINPTTGMKWETGSDQAGTKKLGIETVSGFGNERAPEDTTLRKNLVKGIEERREVREKLKEGEIPYSADLSKLTSNDRGQKREFQEGAAKVRTPGEVLADTENKIIDIAKRIEEAKRESKEPEKELRKEASFAYEQFTGMKLETTVDARARKEASLEGLRVIKIKDFLTEERKAKTQEELRSDIREDNINKRWETVLSEKARSQYGSVGKYKEVLEAKRQSLEKQGFSIPEDVFYGMVGENVDGKSVNVEAIDKTWFGGKIKIPGVKDKPMSKQEFDIWAQGLQAQWTKYFEDRSMEVLNEKVEKGKENWKNKKGKCRGDVLTECVGQIEESRKAKIETKLEPVVEKPKLEIASVISREGGPEMMKGLQKIRKEVEADIKKKMANKKALTDAISKQKAGKLLTARELGLIRDIFSSREK